MIPNLHIDTVHTTFISYEFLHERENDRVRAYTKTEEFFSSLCSTHDDVEFNCWSKGPAWDAYVELESKDRKQLEAVGNEILRYFAKYKNNIRVIT